MSFNNSLLLTLFVYAYLFIYNPSTDVRHMIRITCTSTRSPLKNNVPDTLAAFRGHKLDIRPWTTSASLQFITAHTKPKIQRCSLSTIAVRQRYCIAIATSSLTRRWQPERRNCKCEELSAPITVLQDVFTLLQTTQSISGDPAVPKVDRSA